MTRILLLAALALFTLVAVRRALAAGKQASPPPPRSRGPGPQRGEPRRHTSKAPEQLVCGACGHEFDPEQSGWVCPQCGK